MAIQRIDTVGKDVISTVQLIEIFECIKEQVN